MESQSPEERRWQEMCRLTEVALNDPQPGDYWNEHWSWHMYVIAREGNLIATLSAPGPCTFPDDGKREVRTLEQFKKWLSYGKIPGCWAKCVERGQDVSGWNLLSTEKLAQ
jgi:hypothetical protein